MTRSRTSSLRGSGNTMERETINISAEALEGLVVQTLTLHVEEDTTFSQLQDHVKQLADHSRCQGRLCNFQQQQHCQYCCNTRLNEIEIALGSVIQGTPSLPSQVTAETHSKIGLLRQKQGNSSGAIQSFLKALWIQSSLEANMADATERTDLLWKIAMTKHRLGLAFARNGNFNDAVRLLQNAVQDYQAHHSHDGGRYQKKKFLVEAETALHNTMEAQTLQSVLAAQKTSPAPPLPPPFARSKTISVPRRAKSAEQQQQQSPTMMMSGSWHSSSTRRRASFASMA